MTGEANGNCKYSDSLCKMIKLLKKYYTYNELSQVLNIPYRTSQDIILKRKDKNKISKEVN